MVYRQRQNVWDKSLIAINDEFFIREYGFILQKEPFSSKAPCLFLIRGRPFDFWVGGGRGGYG